MRKNYAYAKLDTASTSSWRIPELFGYRVHSNVKQDTDNTISDLQAKAHVVGPVCHPHINSLGRLCNPQWPLPDRWCAH